MWQGLLYLLYLKYTILQGQNTSSDPMSILDVHLLPNRAHTHASCTDMTASADSN